VITASADDACPPSHAEAIFGALASPDKQRAEVAGANHYFSGPNGRDHLAEAARIIGDWTAARDFAA